MRKSRINERFSVVIVDYGTLCRTVRYIMDFLKACPVQSQEVNFIIVDNWDKKDLGKRQEEAGFVETHDFYDGWHEQSFKILSQFIENSSVWLISVNKNLGYAKANNIGALFSKNILDVKYTIFSNNDIQFPEILDPCSWFEYFRLNPQCLLIGPEVLGIDGNRQGPIQKNDTAFGILLRPYSLFRLIIPSRTVYPDLSFRKGKVHHVNGCFMIVNLGLFMHIGMFDEGTFLYYEEDILSEKAKQAGLYCYFDASITIIHEGGATTKKTMIPIEQKKRLFESACYYYKKYRNSSCLLIGISRINFYFLFVPLYPILNKIFK